MAPGYSKLAGLCDDPGTLGRIGPVTAVQARRLAQAAAGDPAAQWRIIITNNTGQAIAVTRIRRQRSRAGPGPERDGPRSSGLVGRVTLTIPDARPSLEVRVRAHPISTTPRRGRPPQYEGWSGGSP